MSIAVRRAGAYVLVGALSLLAPALVGWGGLGAALPAPPAVGGAIAIETVVAALPFALVALGALLVGRDSRLFEWFARPGDYEEGRLYGLAGFGLGAAALTIVGLQFGMPLSVYVGTVLLLVVGTLAEKATLDVVSDAFIAASAFVVAGFGAAVIGQLAAAVLAGQPDAFVPAEALFLGVTGALLAALLRQALYERDDPLVLFVVAFSLWVFADLPLGFGPSQVLVALAITVVLGYLSYALETASVAGMLTGVLLAFLTVMLGNYGLFAVLITFFGVGGLATKFRYDRKLSRGIAEENDGARGTGNVLANSAVALAAVIGYAVASRPDVAIPQSLFVYAFVGSVAAAMSDTLSSEIGGLYDQPRLITTLQPVPPGTDGAVTWQGEVAGVIGAALVAAVAAVFFPPFVETLPLSAAVVVLAGIAGMTADSLLGATVEGRQLDNMGVNFLATFVAALTGAALALAVGLVAL